MKQIKTTNKVGMPRLPQPKGAIPKLPTKNKPVEIVDKLVSQSKVRK